MATFQPKQIYLFFLLPALLCSCGNNRDIDVSDINLNLTIERFDHDFDDMRTKPMPQQAQYLQKQYSIFYPDYIERILQAGSTTDTAYFETLRMVFAGKAYTDLKHAVDSVFPDLDKQTRELTDAFKRIKYYYPEKKLPRLYAYFSGFQAQTSIGDGYFAIGLDMFLGADSKFYPALLQNFPRYISRRFTPENITPRVIEGIVREDMFPEDDKDKSLLAKMIYNGKIMYFMDEVMPGIDDTLKIGYTRQQMQWCENFEGNIWAYVLEENLLYNSDYQQIQKYFNEAPFTPGLGEHNDSAPKLAIFTGWQIVRRYMRQNPDVTLQQLMAEKDAQKILNDAKYRPE